MSDIKFLITGATGATAPPPHHSFSIKASMFVLSCIARTNDPKNFASVGRRSGRSDRSTSVIQQTSDSKADVEEGPGRVKNGSVGASTSFPLYPTKQTSTVATATSVSCQERKVDPRTGNICRQRKRPMFATPPRHGLVMI